MKIAILTSGRLPVPAVQGGAVENLIDFCLEYNDSHRLHDITVYSVSHPLTMRHHALKSTINHFYYVNMSGLLPKIWKKIYAFLNKQRYYDDLNELFLHRIMHDIIQKEYQIIIIENRPGYVLKLKGKTHAQLVIHQENDYLNRFSYKYQEIYDASSLIINTSDYITQRVKTINKDDTKCVTVLNGIDTTHFYNASPIPRESLGISHSDFVIVYSGRLTKDKGIMQLIQATKRLKEIPHIKLLIIGASFYGKNKNTDPFIDKLKAEVAPIKEKVIFTGFVNYQHIPSYLKMADIAVVPSMWEEPFGLTVVEAMVAGLPLITTNSGGIPEICEGVATIVDRENIIENLVATILALYQHPEKRNAMSQAALKHAQLFSKERYAENFFKAISSV